MILLIFSLVFGSITSSDVVKNFSDAAFAPANNPIKITRVHYSADMDEMYSEYIYKDGDRIRIDADYGDTTVTTFVYDGKTGFSDGRALAKTSSLEAVLYGCSCGYLSGLEKASLSMYDGSNAVVVSGRQGNKLYLDYNTHLPFAYELKTKRVEFNDYKKLDGLGNIPYKVVISGNGETAEIIEIQDVRNEIPIQKNFFSVPKPKEKTLD